MSKNPNCRSTIYYYVRLCLKSYVCVDLFPQAPEELQRLVNLVKDEPLPADAPPLPEENQSEDTAGDMDGGEGFIGLKKSTESLLFQDHFAAFTCGNIQLYH